MEEGRVTVAIEVLRNEKSPILLTVLGKTTLVRETQSRREESGTVVTSLAKVIEG
jgi:hypothetical protein